MAYVMGLGGPLLSFTDKDLQNALNQAKQVAQQVAQQVAPAQENKPPMPASWAAEVPPGAVTSMPSLPFLPAAGAGPSPFVLLGFAGAALLFLTQKKK